MLKYLSQGYITVYWFDPRNEPIFIWFQMLSSKALTSHTHEYTYCLDGLRAW